MSPNDLPPTKRARTSSNATSGAKGVQDEGEDPAQVANLVERRRLQNRISQQNYRNKIRVRLEKLEALVDANALGETQKSEKEKKKDKEKAHTSTSPAPQAPKLQNRSGSAENAAKSNVQDEQDDVPSDPSELWKSIPDFLNLVETDGDNSGHSPEMQDLGISLGSSHLETLSSASTLVDPVRSTSKCDSSSPPSFEMYQSEEFNPGPISSEADRKPIPATEGDPRYYPAESNPGCAFSHRPNFSPYGHYGCAGMLPMSPLSPLGAPIIPFSPLAYSNASSEEGMGNPTGNNCWQGMPSFGPVHAPCISHHPYVWVPVPVPVLGAVPPEVAKLHQYQPASLNGKKP